MLKNKKVFILGMARSGFEAAKILANDNTVLVTDMNEQNPEQVKILEDLGVKIEIVKDPIDLLDDTYDVMVKNPGINYDHPTVVKAKELGIEVINEEVVSIENYGTLEVITNKNKYEGKAIYLAVGKSKSKLNKKGLKEFEGKGISYCATCDGFFFRNKKIGIIGSGDYMLKELEVLRNFSDDIIVFSSIDLDIKEKIVKEEIIEFYGNEKLEGVKTINNDYKLDAVFIALGSMDGLSIAKHLGLILDEKNNIVVNDYMSNIEGVFAGGDVIGGLLQVSKAVSDGAKAAVSINKYLKSRK